MAYTELFNWVYIAGSGKAYSHAVTLDGDNAATVQVVHVTGSSSATAQLEQSNDLTNWTTVGGSGSPAAAPSVTYMNVTSISAAYVRLVITAGANPSIFCANINTVNI